MLARAAGQVVRRDRHAHGLVDPLLHREALALQQHVKEPPEGARNRTTSCFSIIARIAPIPGRRIGNQGQPPCYIARTTLRAFLTDTLVFGTEGTGREAARTRVWAPRGQRRRPFNIRRIRRVLTRALTDPTHPSLTRIARQVGHDLKTLEQHAPALCRAIQTRYITHLRNGRRREQQRLRRTTRKAIRALRAAAVYPSSRRVALFLGNRGYRRHRDVYSEWKKIMQGGAGRRKSVTPSQGRRRERLSDAGGVHERDQRRPRTFLGAPGLC